MSPAADLALYRAGFAHFAAGEFYEAHEAWEDLWLRNRSEARDFFQGLIQVAAAFHHLDKGRHVGLVRLLAAGADRLRPYPSPYLGLDVAALVAAADRARTHAEALGPARLASFDRALLPDPHFTAPDPGSFAPHAGSRPHPLAKL